MKPYFIIVDDDLKTIFVDYTANYDAALHGEAHIAEILDELTRASGPQYLVFDARKVAFQNEESILEGYESAYALFEHPNTYNAIVIDHLSLYRLTSKGLIDPLFGGLDVEVSPSHVEAILDIRSRLPNTSS